METSGGSKQRIVKIVDGDIVDGGVFPVIDDSGFSRIRAILVKIDTETGIGRTVIDKIVIAHTAETDLVFGICTDIVCGKFGDNAGPKTQEGDAGYHVQFRTADLFLEGSASDKTLVSRRRETQENFAE